MRPRSPSYYAVTAVLAIQLLTSLACDDPTPGPVGGLVLAIRSFEATSDPDLQEIKSVEILTDHIEVQHSTMLGGDSRFLTVDTQARTIVVKNSGQTDLLVAQYQVPPGFVSQIRIFPRAVTLHLKSGPDVSLGVPSSNLPSWDQSGWKIEPTDGNPWPIAQDVLTGVRVLFHFDNLMLHNKGNGYKIKPTAPAELFPVNPPDDGIGVFADQLTVLFKLGVRPDQIDDINAQIGASILIAPVLSTAYRIKLPASKNLQDGFNFYRDQASVQAVVPAINFGLTQVSPSEGIQPQQIQCNLPSAWSRASSLQRGHIGDRRIRVAQIDTGVAINHPHLYRNIAINQREIPPAIAAQLKDTDGDGIITFVDLNDSANAALVPPDDNGNGYIDGQDLIANPGDLCNVGHGNPWLDGIDNDNNGMADDLVGWNFEGVPDCRPEAHGSRFPTDDDGHGTAVAGILGSGGNLGMSDGGIAGTAWEVSIIPIRVTDHASPPNMKDVRLFDAMVYAESMHADIILLEAGHTFSSTDAVIDDCSRAFLAGKSNQPWSIDKDPTAFAEAKDNYAKAYMLPPWRDALDNSIVITKAFYISGAGNAGLNLAEGHIEFFPATPLKTSLKSARSSPMSGFDEHVLIVGNCQNTDFTAPTLNCDSAALDSNYGTGVVELWAPGVGWTSLSPSGGTATSTSGHNQISGTSFAAPVVVGTAALAMSLNSNLIRDPGVLHDQLILRSDMSAFNMMGSNHPSTNLNLNNGCIMTSVGPAIDTSNAIFP